MMRIVFSLCVAMAIVGLAGCQSQESQTTPGVWQPKKQIAPEQLTKLVVKAATERKLEEIEGVVGRPATYSSLRAEQTMTWVGYMYVTRFAPSGKWASGWSDQGTEGIMVWVLDTGRADVIGVRWTKERKPILFSGNLGI
jgi:hypothetical protein